jgi:hypothetical protein
MITAAKAIAATPSASRLRYGSWSLAAAIRVNLRVVGKTAVRIIRAGCLGPIHVNCFVPIDATLESSFGFHGRV